MKSMTGYYSLQQEVKSRLYSIEIKSVNSRYLDLNLHMSHIFQFLEPEIRDAVNGTIQRGKIDINLDIRERDRSVKITVNKKLASEYRKAYQEVQQSAGLEGDLPLQSLIGAEGVIQTESVLNKDVLTSEIRSLMKKALPGFEKIRKHDGDSVKKDIFQRLNEMKKELSAIKKQTANAVVDYRKQLEKRLKRIVGKELDQNLLITEAGILANKADINEEISRLESHIRLFEKTARQKDPVGRTLDFVCQEMNREINTIGSKQNDFSIAQQVVLLKTALEKIREQVRNVE